MTAKEFANKAFDIAQNYKTAYIWGGDGRPITEGNLQVAERQYSENTTRGYAARARQLIGSPKAFSFDCVGLIKAILWGWNGDATKTRGGAIYPTTAQVLAGACPDTSADGMIRLCTYTSADFSRIVPGAVVWLSGHIGIYIGGGLAVECTPKWSGGVQITAVANIGLVEGRNARKWTKWGTLPYITYEEEQEMTEKEIKALVVETVKDELGPIVKEAVAAALEKANPIYKDLADVPDYWKGVAAALLDTGAVDGGTSAKENPTDLNIREETLKAAVIAVRYHEAREARNAETPQEVGVAATRPSTTHIETE